MSDMQDEDAPLLTVKNEGKNAENGEVTERHFNGDEDVEETPTDGKNETGTEKQRGSGSRIRRNKRGASASADKQGRQHEGENASEEVAANGGGGGEEEDGSGDNVPGHEKPKQLPSVRHDGLCMPVATCLASCFGGMGMGFRKRDTDRDIPVTGRVINKHMWGIIKHSTYFKNVEETAFCVNIGRLSDLQGILGSAVKPFVKVHIVDIDSGHYIRPEVTGKVTMARAACAPLLTRQASLRGTSSDVPEWREELIFPGVSFRDVVSPQNIVLFEVLDDPPSLSFKKAQAINSSKDNATRVRTFTTLAWAFLLPVGQQVNVGYPRTPTNSINDHAYSDMSLRLQLYKYQADTTVTKLQRAANRWPAAEISQQKMQKTEVAHRYPDNIPEVFLQYKRQQLALKGEHSMNSGGESQEALDPRSSQAQEDQVKAQLRLAKMKRSRAPSEPCVVPDKLLHRVDAGPEGGMVVCFSHKGHLLAVGAPSPSGFTVPFAPAGGTSPFADTSYCMRLFCPDTGVEVWADLSAHFGVIYDIQWSLADDFFLTCSSDGCCKVWRLADGSGEPLSSAASPNKRSAKMVRQKHSVTGAGVHTNVAFSILQEFPTLVATLAHNPPVYVYTAIFQEYSTGKPDSGRSSGPPLHPPVITGAADGRVRVWTGSRLAGDLVIGEGGGEGVGSHRRKFSSPSRLRHGSIRETDVDPQDYRVDSDDVPHYGGKVQALAIDVRSKYLFSGDSRGQILIWRPNGSGWYQLLRKFRKDDLHGRSIASLSVYPDRAKGCLLVLALPSLADAPHTTSSTGQGTPGEQSNSGKVLTTAVLKMYDLGTYRAQHSFPGLVLTNTFCRATFSADGRYVACGTIVRNHDGTGVNHIRFWDTVTGRHVEDTKMGSLPYPFIPRSIAWHPKQHVVAVAMVGHGAAVGIYCANKARNIGVVTDFEDVEAGSEGASTQARDSPLDSSESHAMSSSPSRLKKHKFRKAAARKSEDGVAGHEGGDREPEVRTKEQRAARTRELLDKIKAAKARAKGEQLLS